MSSSGRFVLALFLVTLTGFISLSYEILWVRLYSFVSASRAWAFGVLLGSYLIGLALGSLWSLRFQGDGSEGRGQQELRALAGFVGMANGFGFLVVPVVSWMVVWIHFGWTFPIVVVAAALLGAALPLICHYAIPPDEKAGARLSYLYLGNILGAGAGSLLTGFVLMDRFTIAQISVILVVLGFLLVFGLDYFSGKRGRLLAVRAGGVVIASALALVASGPLFDGLYERLQYKEDYDHQKRFTMVVESRFGVITVDDDEKIFGGGIFDGVLTTDLSPGSWTIRPYFISAVHSDPKEVLVIGLSGGTWTQILASHPQVDSVTAVEINAAYSERIIPKVASSKSILKNPKVEIIIDDGRRWLRRNPERKFDAVVINCTYHWREHATNLLSKEFMEQIRDHLKPGGIYLFNATGSERAAKTATEVFPDTVTVLNNVLSSNRLLTFDRERWRRVLSDYRIDGQLVFEPDESGQIDDIVSMIDTRGDREIDISRRILSRDQILEDTKDLEIITDDNLGHEFESR